MKEIYTLDPIVKRVLAEYPDTRNSDSLLYVTVCNQINPCFSKLPLEEALLRRRELGLPNMATVGRIRRKAQQHTEGLRATISVRDRRYDNWQTVRDYVQD